MSQANEADEGVSWTAVHEAGHAVIALALGLPCKHITIVADHESSGHCIIPDQWAILEAWEERERWRGERTAILGRIITYMAGAEAEIEIYGRCTGRDGDDRVWIGRMLDSIVRDKQRVAYESRLRRHTRTLVRRHRAVIERLASMLDDRKALTREELVSLVRLEAGSRPDGGPAVWLA